MESFEAQPRDPSRYAEEKGIESRAKERLEALLPLLHEEAAELRKRGFPVDDECRIDPMQFQDVFDRETIIQNRRTVEELDRKYKDESSKAIGELLETVKTLTFNRQWFKGRLVALRTAKFDDFRHGVDELVFDTYTKQPFAALDDTLDPNLKDKKLLEKVQRGMSVKYGLEMDFENKVNKKPLEKLPYFIVTINAEKLLALATELAAGEKGPLSETSEAMVLQTLKTQSDVFEKHTSGDLKKRYQETGELWKKLIERTK